LREAERSLQQWEDDQAADQKSACGDGGVPRQAKGVKGGKDGMGTSEDDIESRMNVPARVRSVEASGAHPAARRVRRGPESGSAEGERRLKKGIG
jgi:hypothetical protein